MFWDEPEREWWFEKKLKHLGESQGVPKWLSPNEMIQKLQIQNQLNLKPGKEKRAKTRLSQTSPT